MAYVGEGIKGLCNIEVKKSKSIYFKNRGSVYVDCKTVSEIHVNPEEVSLIVIEKGDQ